MRDDEQYTSDERLYLDREGKVVKADDPTRHMLLVAAGGHISMEKARQYGLVEGESENQEAVSADHVETLVGEAEGKAVHEPPEDKAIHAPESTKKKKTAKRKAK